MSAKNLLSRLFLFLFGAAVAEGQVQTMDSSYRYGQMGMPYVNQAVALPPVPEVPAKASTSIDVIRNLPDKLSLSQAKEALNSLADLRADRRYNGLLKIAAAV